ncbi:MAG: 1-acyl-sn-glycerol-3-phosphate acyltransferase, partial [Rubrobacteraceae bacterium]
YEVLDNAPRLRGVNWNPVVGDEDQDQVSTLAKVCTDDLLSAFGLGELRYGRLPLELLSSIPTRRLALQIATYDRLVGEAGLAAGGTWAMKRMSRHAAVEGLDSLPEHGPVLFVSNHPGLADAVALFAAIPRPDLRIVAAERPFLSALPNTSRYLLTINEKSPERLALVRQANRHLKRGGAMLTFPGGRIEPDPAVLPGADAALEDWSSSVEFFARLEPNLVVVPVAVSGVISTAALRNPLVFLRRRKEDQRWLAATIQMLVPRMRDVTTRVTFGEPIRARDSGTLVGPAVLQEMRRLIHDHEACR